MAVFICIAALIVRLAALASFNAEQSLFYVADSNHYVQVAKNLIEHGVYSMEISDTPHPDNFRTPLYPLFLLPFILIKTSFYAPVIVQILAVSLSMAGIFLLARRVFNERVAAAASILFAIEPFAALINAQLLTEALFVALFVPAVLLFMRYAQTGFPRFLYGGSALLALAGLVRPISFYFFVFIPVLIVIANHKRIAWRHMAAGLCIFFLIVSPWIMFNAIALKTFSVSSISNLQLYEYYGRYFDRWRAERGVPEEERLPEISLDPVNDTFNARAIPPIAEVGREYLWTHKGEYVIYHISRMPRLFTDSGYASILNGIPGLNFYLDTSHIGGFLDQIRISELGTALRTVREQPVLIGLLLADMFFAVITILAVLNPLAHWRRRRIIPKEIIFLWLLLAAYTVIASPIGGARFRIPINLFLFLMAFQTIMLIYRGSAPQSGLYEKSL